MTICELIERLTEQWEKHGNLEVYYWTRDELEPVRNVAQDHDSYPVVSKIILD